MAKENVKAAIHYTPVCRSWQKEFKTFLRKQSNHYSYKIKFLYRWWRKLCITSGMEVVAKTIALYISHLVEITAAVVIGIAFLQLLFGYVKLFFAKNKHHSNTYLRVQFGSALTLALELMLAADILITAVAPTWEDIGKLAAIAAIRTALNYFLEKELVALETRNKDQSENIK